MVYDAARSCGNIAQHHGRLGVALRAMYNHFEKEHLPKQLQELVGRLGEKRGDR